MKVLISLINISKSYGAKTLFDELNLSIHQNEKISIIGKNGTGKSTLLKIISEADQPDSGTVTIKKNIKISYISQSPSYNPEDSLHTVIQKKLFDSSLNEDEQNLNLQISLSTCGFLDFNVKTKELSGGWIKRLAVAEAICTDPDILLLDEPTNHMDWDSIYWLESFLKRSHKTIILISHDREFLQATTNRTIEISSSYEKGYLSFDVPYYSFIEKRREYFEALEKSYASLSNKAKRELEWLRAGVKARTTKSRSRIDEAHHLFEALKKTKNQLQISKNKMNLKVDSTSRKSKKLVELKSISKSFDDLQLFKDMDWTFTPKMKCGLLGKNGTGKTTLVKIITNEIKPTSGNVYRADDLKIVYFDQKKQTLKTEQTVLEYLGEGSDHIQFQGQSIHVISYAKRFLFQQEHFNIKIQRLSGGEKAKLQLAKILLNPCDLLILDEPTNDLDIESLTFLEETLAELKAGVILISHDRAFLSNICTHYIGFHKNQNWNYYADIHQWLKNPPQQKEKTKKESTITKKKKPLSYKEKKELESIEDEIMKNEAQLETLNFEISNPKNSSNSEKLLDLSKEIATLQTTIQNQYARWEELEQKKI